MRSRRSKYQLADSRRGSHGGFFGFLCLLTLAALAWIWWQTGKTTAPPILTKHTNMVSRTAALPSVPILRTNAISDPLSETIPRPARNIFEVQLALDRQGISAGPLDGLIGSQTRSALCAFQRKEHLPVTGEPDAETKARIVLTSPPYTNYTITSNDLARLQPLSSTWLGKSQQTALDFESVLELAAELSHSHPNLLRQLNPGIEWTNTPVGSSLRVPDASYTVTPAKAAFIRISLGEKTLEAFDAATNLLVHFPCSIARLVEKRPAGELHVISIAQRPNYTFDPDVFPESPEARELQTKLVLPPGPNNPVGIAWIGLDRAGYGIHGTPKPEDVGRTESHGCFRLANWNVDLLLKLVWSGLPVYVEP